MRLNTNVDDSINVVRSDSRLAEVRIQLFKLPITNCKFHLLPLYLRAIIDVGIFGKSVTIHPKSRSQGLKHPMPPNYACIENRRFNCTIYSAAVKALVGHIRIRMDFLRT